MILSIIFSELCAIIPIAEVIKEAFFADFKVLGAISKHHTLENIVDPICYIQICKITLHNCSASKLLFLKIFTQSLFVVHICIFHDSLTFKGFHGSPTYYKTFAVKSIDLAYCRAASLAWPCMKQSRA